MAPKGSKPRGSRGEPESRGRALTRGPTGSQVPPVRPIRLLRLWLIETDAYEGDGCDSSIIHARPIRSAARGKCHCPVRHCSHGNDMVQATPSRISSLEFPARGSPQDLGPGTTASRGRANSPSKQNSPTRWGESPASSRGGSPIRMPEVSMAHTETWLSMKHPDMLSASERVMHHNLTNVAMRLDNMQQGFIRFASVRMTGKSPYAFSEPPLSSRPHDLPLLDNFVFFLLSLSPRPWAGVVLTTCDRQERCCQGHRRSRDGRQ